MIFRKKMFRKLSLLFIVVFLFLAVIVSVILTSYIYKESLDVVKQNSSDISRQLENVIEQMDLISVQCVTDKVVQTNMLDAFEDDDSNENYFDLHISQKNQILSRITATNSIKSIVDAVYIYNQKNDYVGVGKSMNNSLVYRKEYIQDVFQTMDDKLIDMRIEKSMWHEEEIEVLSYYRIVKSLNSGETIGIIETQKEKKILQDVCSSIYQDKIDIHIQDGKGDILYSTKQGVTMQKLLISEAKVIPVNWKVIVEYNYSSFFREVLIVLSVVWTGFLILTVTTLIVIRFLIKKMTKSLEETRNNILNYSCENHFSKTNTTSQIDEIDLINDAFKKVVNELEEANMRKLQSQTSELHSYLLSLQAQINPHFLYNTLMNISAVGVECGSKKIVDMCKQLSDFFRYTSSGSNENITLRDEIKITESYLKLMKSRYGEHLEYSIVADPNMLDINVPKMIIQPFVENCINHAFNQCAPVWKISIVGRMEEKKWVIRIQDNGVGICETKKQEIKNNIINYIEEIEKGTLHNKFSCGGMGIANIYLRMYLYYRGNFHFEIIENIQKGSAIEIGGTICNG